jgi:hypothetical protein
VLVAWGAAKRGWWDIADEYMDGLPTYLESARFTIENSNPRPEAATAADAAEVVDTEEGALLPLDLAEDLPLMVGGGYRDVHDAVTEGAELGALQAEVEAACGAWEAQHGEKMTLSEMQHVRKTAKHRRPFLLPGNRERVDRIDRSTCCSQSSDQQTAWCLDRDRDSTGPRCPHATPGRPSPSCPACPRSPHSHERLQRSASWSPRRSGQPPHGTPGRTSSASLA